MGRGGKREYGVVSKHSKRVPACGFCAVQVPCPNSQNCLLGRGSPMETSKRETLWSADRADRRDVPDPYEKRRLPMANRKRNIQMKFYVTEEEKRLIDEKMAQLPTHRYGAYLRKMAIDGYNAAHFRPQAAFIRKAPSLPRGGEGVAGKAAREDGNGFKSCFFKKRLLRKSCDIPEFWHLRPVLFQNGIGVCLHDSRCQQVPAHLLRPGEGMHGKSGRVCRGQRNSRVICSWTPLS